MSRLITNALAAAAALGLAAPALAQDSMGAMSNNNVPWCSSTITDECRQHEGMSGTMMHHGMTTHNGWMMHHRLSKHHRMMHRMMKRHGLLKHHNMMQRNTSAHHKMMHGMLERHDTMKKM